MHVVLSTMAAALSLGVAASAATLLPGTYRLANHPDGNAQPPQYGLRLDNLFGGAPAGSIFTFDFNDSKSNVNMTVDDVNHKIRIWGQAFGGRDIGSAYANDQYRGVYTFEFNYSISVGLRETTTARWAARTPRTSGSSPAPRASAA